MRGNTVFFQHFENEVGTAVVYHALAGNFALFKTVKRSRVVLIRNKHDVLVVGCVHFFGFALVKLFAFFHFITPPINLYLNL